MKKHYVLFLSPGTFFDEQSLRPIDQFGDVLTAVEMAKSVTERHNAKPYGFRFVTRMEHDPIPDGEGGTLAVEPKTLVETGTYFINGTLRKYDDVLAKNDPKEITLLSNMRNNGPIVVETRNSWRHTAAFAEGDFVVNDLGGIMVRGNDPELVAYRQEVVERIERERCA